MQRFDDLEEQQKAQSDGFLTPLGTDHSEGPDLSEEPRAGRRRSSLPANISAGRPVQTCQKVHEDENERESSEKPALSERGLVSVMAIVGVAVVGITAFAMGRLLAKSTYSQ